MSDDSWLIKQNIMLLILLASSGESYWFDTKRGKVHETVPRSHRVSFKQEPVLTAGVTHDATGVKQGQNGLFLGRRC